MASTAQTIDARSVIGRDAPNRVVLHDISWEFYENLRADDANRHIRMSYDQGELELMSPSRRHSSIEVRFGLFIVEIARKLGLKCKPLGNATWTKSGLLKGKEADGCFYFANFERIRKKEIDLHVDPPPDLAIEVEVSRSAVNALGIYAAIGVPEIWRYDGARFQIHHRQVDGTYLEVEVSPTLPFLRPEGVVEWLARADELDDDMEWIERVGEWVLNVLAPRLEQP